MNIDAVIARLSVERLQLQMQLDQANAKIAELEKQVADLSPDKKETPN